MGPEVIVPLGFFASVVAVVLFRPLIKVMGKKVEAEAKRPAIPAEMSARL